MVNPLALALLAMALLLGATSAAGQFVTRNGAQLELDGRPFRWCGTNSYWLGLDENVGGVHYPTKFRILDGLTTSAGLNYSVVRGHTLGISTGNPLSFEPSLGVFNDSALDAADYAIFVADSLGIKLQIPLTDPYGYYHGSLKDFLRWIVGSPNADPSIFYTNETVIDAFKAYIRARLVHVNPYTKRPTFAEPSIMAWETGNELSNVPPAWTESIAAFIKGIAPNHLVMDGRYGVDPQSLPSPHVDLYSDHFYPIDVNRLKTGSALAAAAGKAYIAGEFGWTSGDVTGFLDTVVADTNISGTMYWSLFPHLDTHGFVEHNDGFTVHYPGDNSGMAALIATVRQHSAKIAGLPSPPPLPPPSTPAVTGCMSGNSTVVWRGAALAATYSVETGASSTGPWTNVCDACATDNETPWRLPKGHTIGPGTWVHVQGVNGDGLAGAWSDPAQCA
jgi:hypothetical protein